MNRKYLPVLLVLAALALAGTGFADSDLRPAKDFAHIKDKAARSVALFEEAGKVLTHQRCVNCHPSGDQPLQGEAGTLHEPPVARGSGGLGVVGMRCSTCHGDANFDPGHLPGAPHWHLAPRKAAWEGLSLGEICRQLKDRERNGGRDLSEIVEHMKEDALVAWGWQPGEGREPAPGSQQVFGELIAAWAKTGAACPDP
jgi:cytochrome c5